MLSIRELSPGKERQIKKTPSITAGETQRPREVASLCASRLQDWVGGGGSRVCVWGGQRARTEGAASLTQNSSAPHHIHLSDPLPIWPARRRKVVAEIAKQETDTESPQVRGKRRNGGAKRKKTLCVENWEAELDRDKEWEGGRRVRGQRE